MTFKPGSKLEKAHPAIAPLLRVNKLTPMEFRVRCLKAGVRVLKRVKRHLANTQGFDRMPEVDRSGIQLAFRDAQQLTSELAAELEGLKYR